MYYEGSQALRPNQRVFALHRNGHAGMQGFAAFLWSGDVYTTWETLKTHVLVAVNTGLTGIPYWGTDIGGFVPTKEYTGELHVRWFQFGAFCPLFRAHGRTWHLRLPWGWNTGKLGHNEISNYTGGAANPEESELHNAAVEPICKKYLELRSRLTPYLYSAVCEMHETGLPVMRALWLHYPDDATAVLRGDQYLWGRELLVAPVVEKGASTRNVYLPCGDWYDFWTEERMAGGREVSKAVDLATMPLYVRAGAILPLGPVKQYTEEVVDAPLTFVIYPGADGSFTWYEDDGKTDIWGVIYRPTNYDPLKKYPVIENIYAGPHSSHVPKTFSASNPMQALAELGFIVVQIDGMGTSNRSKAFHDVAWKNLGDAGFPDRILWHKAVAAKYRYYDITRVGIYGTSAGGQNALGALLFHPEFYKVCVSSCGCHDNRMDKIWWNEQWMGWPLGEHYSASSNVDNAHRLQGKLLLILGELDTNVDPASTMQFVNALIKADKVFDFLEIPGAGHTNGGAYGDKKRYDFFVQHLLDVKPPDWNKVEKKKAAGAESN
jgi:dienelactone hydrolase